MILPHPNSRIVFANLNPLVAYTIKFSPQADTATQRRTYCSLLGGSLAGASYSKTGKAESNAVLTLDAVGVSDIDDIVGYTTSTLFEIALAAGSTSVNVFNNADANDPFSIDIGVIDIHLTATDALVDSFDCNNPNVITGVLVGSQASSITATAHAFEFEDEITIQSIKDTVALDENEVTASGTTSIVVNDVARVDSATIGGITFEGRVDVDGNTFTVDTPADGIELGSNPLLQLSVAPSALKDNLLGVIGEFWQSKDSVTDNDPSVQGDTWWGFRGGMRRSCITPTRAIVFDATWEDENITFPAGVAGKTFAFIDFRIDPSVNGYSFICVFSGADLITTLDPDVMMGLDHSAVGLRFKTGTKDVEVYMTGTSSVPNLVDAAVMSGLLTGKPVSVGGTYNKDTGEIDYYKNGLHFLNVPSPTGTVPIPDQHHKFLVGDRDNAEQDLFGGTEAGKAMTATEHLDCHNEFMLNIRIDGAPAFTFPDLYFSGSEVGGWSDSRVDGGCITAGIQTLPDAAIDTFTELRDNTTIAIAVGIPIYKDNSTTTASATGIVEQVYNASVASTFMYLCSFRCTGTWTGAGFFGGSGGFNGNITGVDGTTDLRINATTSFGPDFYILSGACDGNPHSLIITFDDSLGTNGFGLMKIYLDGVYIDEIDLTIAGTWPLTWRENRGTIAGMDVHKWVSFMGDRYPTAAEIVNGSAYALSDLEIDGVPV